MIGFVNVLEEILVKEVQVQIEELRPERQTKVKTVEVLAYALNRLPPLFATSMIGWQYQYQHALNELHPQISQLVKQGIQTVLFGDPLHDTTPLPNHLFINSAGVLYQLSKVFERRHLRWRDVPILVEETINKPKVTTNINDQTVIQFDEETKIQEVSYVNKSQRGLLTRSKHYMEKQSSQKKQEALLLSGDRVLVSQGQMYGSSWAEDKKVRDALEMEYRALQSYTLEAQLGLTNVLEHLVLRAIERITTPDLYAQINQSEVAAYALNRLPPMYSTSDRGFKYMRQRAISELAKEIIRTVRSGIMKVIQATRIDSQPIYAYQFEQEYEQSMLTLNSLFNRHDITLHNIVAIVQDVISYHSMEVAMHK